MRSGFAGGNSEGKEVRSVSLQSSLFAVVTTAASCGARDRHARLPTALAVLIPLINMELGEVIIAGLVQVSTACDRHHRLDLRAGLMVGRTPEYGRQEIEARGSQDGDAGHARIAVFYLGWNLGRCCSAVAVASMANSGPHGFTEVLYAFTSQTGNNARPSRASQATPSSTISQGPVRCSSAASS